MTRLQVEEVAEVWAKRVADRRQSHWLTDFVLASGGTIRPEPAAPLLIVASSQSDYLISSDSSWQVATSIGHLALHLPHVDTAIAPLAVPSVASPSGEGARTVAEAAWFAAVFLMPGDLFRESWTLHDSQLNSIAREFRVPLISVAARAFRLGLRP